MNATVLCCLNRDVTLHNAMKLAELHSTQKTYKSQDRSSALTRTYYCRTGHKKKPRGPTRHSRPCFFHYYWHSSVVVNDSMHLNIRLFLFTCTSPEATTTRLKFPFTTCMVTFNSLRPRTKEGSHWLWRSLPSSYATCCIMQMSPLATSVLRPSCLSRIQWGRGGVVTMSILP